MPFLAKLMIAYFRNGSFYGIIKGGLRTWLNTKS